MTDRPTTTAQILAIIAAYLEIVDWQRGVDTDEVQRDLTSIALWLTEHPEVDYQIYMYLTTRETT